MPSKMVTDRQKSSESVQAACKTHGPAMAAGITDTLSDPALGTHVSAVIARAAERLHGATDTMLQADNANSLEKGEDTVARERYATVAGDLRSDLVELRAGIVHVYGNAVASTIGFDGPTPDDAVAAERLAGTALPKLAKLSSIEPRVPGFSFDPQPWHSRIEKHLADVRDARSALTSDVRETEATQVAKDRALADYDKTFSCVATLASALLNIAGERELAKRVRPSTRRPGQTVEDAGDPEEPVT